jgi:hypothetical protein
MEREVGGENGRGREEGEGETRKESKNRLSKFLGRST